MPSKINISELVQLVAKSYNRSELEVFLAQYFDVRLDYIIEPSGLSMIKIAQEVVGYFDRRDNLALALDRSGSMQGYKTDVARAAADYLLDIAQRPDHRVSILAFDDYIEIPVPLQQIGNSTPHKSALRRIAPRGETDLFSAWQK